MRQVSPDIRFLIHLNLIGDAVRSEVPGTRPRTTPGKSEEPRWTVEGMHQERRQPGAIAGIVDTWSNPGLQISDP